MLLFCKKWYQAHAACSRPVGILVRYTVMTYCCCTLCRENNKKIRGIRILQRLEELGESSTVLQELSSFEDKFYSHYHESRHHQFEGILVIVKEQQGQNKPDPISAKDHLAVCLRENYSMSVFNELHRPPTMAKTGVLE